MLNFKNLILTILLASFISGCGLKFGSEQSYNDSENKMLFHEVLKVPVDCSDCSDFFGKKITINGREYTSDVAIKCCLAKNLIDTNVGLKKVYIHRIVDRRDSAKGIYYTNYDGVKKVFDVRPSIEALFYMFLEAELNSRGIVVVDTQTSPYTYKLDFDIYSFLAEYSKKSKILDGKLIGKLSLSNINFKKSLEISTKQQVKRLDADEIDEFDFFVALLAKQAANKVVDVISKI